MRKIKLFILIIVMFGLLVFGENSEIQIISWNVQNDGAWTDVIAEQIGDFQDIDLWGLSEVPREAEKDYIHAAGVGEKSNFKGFMSKKGGYDRLMIIYNSNRFELLKKIELKELTLGRKGVRPALGGLFREKESGKSFYFMVNHLYQSNKKKRHKQSRMLKKWALKNKETPIIMVGDYNYNWDIDKNGKKRDPGFDILTNNSVLKWMRISTFCI